MANASRYAVVIDGIVDNIVQWDGVTPWQPHEGEAVCCPDRVGPGWAYNSASGFSAPPNAAE